MKGGHYYPDKMTLEVLKLTEVINKKKLFKKITKVSLIRAL